MKRSSSCPDLCRWSWTTQKTWLLECVLDPMTPCQVTSIPCATCPPIMRLPIRRSEALDTNQSLTNLNVADLISLRSHIQLFNTTRLMCCPMLKGRRKHVTRSTPFETLPVLPRIATKNSKCRKWPIWDASHRRIAMVEQNKRA